MAHRDNNKIIEKYQAAVAAGRLEYDAAQAALAQILDGLADALVKKPNLYSLFYGSFYHAFWRQPKPAANKGQKSKGQKNKGLYIYGDVGRGKSMLMDLFFDSLSDTKIKKWQVHFHIFMQEAHTLLQEIRQNKNTKDPLYEVARILSKRADLICFDEFQVQDIADASILGRLFECLWARGVVIIATSNRPPDDLYAGGLNRHRFLPFIDLLKKKMQVTSLAAKQDYRLATLRAAPVWFVLAEDDAHKGKSLLDERLHALIGDMPLMPLTLLVSGRQWQIEAAAGVVRLSFAALCERAYGAADYWALAQNCHSLLLDDIPRLKNENKNAAMRFIALIDALYEHKVNLIATAACAPAQIYTGSFEFARTVSRLQEMQSVEYLATAHIIADKIEPQSSEKA